MAGFKIDREKLESDKGGDYVKETEIVPAGMNQARLVSYVELGKHIPMFKGKPAEYGKESKKSGEPKPPEFMIQLVFEFPHAKHTGEFPLTIKTSVPYGKGEFVNQLSVSDALMSGNISMAYALRSRFMKYLNALNDSCGTSYDDLHSFVGEPFLVAVTHKVGAKADPKTGDKPVFANMAPDGINSTTYTDQQDMKEKVAQVPEIVGEYCSKFFWDEPTPEAWKEVPKYLKTCMKGADDFEGSPLAAMLAGMPEEKSENQVESKPEDNKGKPAEAADDIPV
jgi:hypothetical protein